MAIPGSNLTTCELNLEAWLNSIEPPQNFPTEKSIREVINATKVPTSSLSFSIKLAASLALAILPLMGVYAANRLFLRPLLVQIFRTNDFLGRYIGYGVNSLVLFVFHQKVPIIRILFSPLSLIQRPLQDNIRATDTYKFLMALKKSSSLASILNRQIINLKGSALKLSNYQIFEENKNSLIPLFQNEINCLTKHMELLRKAHEIYKTYWWQCRIISLITPDDLTDFMESATTLLVGRDLLQEEKDLIANLTKHIS